MSGKTTNPPPTPGEILRELLEGEPQITQDRLASAMGVTRYSINQLVNDHRNITPEMALRLAKALSTTPDFWLNLQLAVDLHRSRRKLAAELASVRRVRTAMPDHELFDDMTASTG